MGQGYCAGRLGLPVSNDRTQKDFLADTKFIYFIHRQYPNDTARKRQDI